MSRGYAGLSQGWLWEYYMQLICSPVRLHLTSRFGAWHQAVQEPSWFFSIMSCGEALCGLEVWGVGILLLLGDFFSTKCASSISARF
jgi:hypothetical protein